MSSLHDEASSSADFLYDNGRMADLDKLKHDPDFQRHTYRVLAASAILLIAAGTVIFSLLEDWSIVDSFYFSVVTATTVGFGDITPDTDGAKLFTVVYIIFGISIIGTFLDARFKKRAYERTNRIERTDSSEN
jgi:voltage-gated potassium channel Kch